ncbi:hypothetical protein BN1723_007485 [Verticillium longisporum]|uniref:Uncharacterized protein n=1 Tax=Verticillium longisporum TaxID=100787 RepID=A0A0G4NLU0_VERLO|nr:hypothetical protein BN1723_007485 [Verticillium longisporum]
MLHDDLLALAVESCPERDDKIVHVRPGEIETEGGAPRKVVRQGQFIARFIERYIDRERRRTRLLAQFPGPDLIVAARIQRVQPRVIQQRDARCHEQGAVVAREETLSRDSEVLRPKVRLQGCL